MQLQIPRVILAANNCIQENKKVKRCCQVLYTKGKLVEIIRSKEFKADKAWGAKNIASMNGVTTKLHWTDEPYKWHINDGEEVFVVLNGKVDMHYREKGIEKKVLLNSGDIFFASMGTEHVAHPIGEARVLVIEKEGSV